MMRNRQAETETERGLSQTALAFCALVIVVGFLSLADPAVHLYASLPMVLVALCPLLRTRPRETGPRRGKLVGGPGLR